MRIVNFNSNILVCIEEPRWKPSNINEIRKVIGAYGFKNKSFCIKLSNNKLIQTLNMRWRGINRPTNVLSFPNQAKFIPQEEDCYLGDIVLGYEVIKNESIKKNLPINKHLSHILIHGILHLDGYKHNEKKDEIVMQKEEVRILKKLKINNPYYKEKNNLE